MIMLESMVLWTFVFDFLSYHLVSFISRDVKQNFSEKGKILSLARKEKISGLLLHKCYSTVSVWTIRLKKGIIKADNRWGWCRIFCTGGACGFSCCSPVVVTWCGMTPSRVLIPWTYARLSRKGDRLLPRDSQSKDVRNPQSSLTADRQSVKEGGSSHLFIFCL